MEMFALCSIILLICAASLLTFTEVGNISLCLCVRLSYCSQFAFFNIKMVLKISLRTIGKWSLPWRSLSISHLACGAKVAEQSERSICVYVLCVEKCVGDLSFSKISCVLSINCCIVFPRE